MNVRLEWDGEIEVYCDDCGHDLGQVSRGADLIQDIIDDHGSECEHERS